jgi:hypothetical protein
MKGMSSEGVVTKGRIITRRCGRNCRGLIDRSLLGTPVLHRGVRQPDARCARLDSSLRAPCHGR